MPFAFCAGRCIRHSFRPAQLPWTRARHQPVTTTLFRHHFSDSSSEMAAETFESQGVRIAVEGCVSPHLSLPLLWLVCLVRMASIDQFSSPGPCQTQRDIRFRRAICQGARLGWRRLAHHRRRLSGTFFPCPHGADSPRFASY